MREGEVGGRTAVVFGWVLKGVVESDLRGEPRRRRARVRPLGHLQRDGPAGMVDRVVAIGGTMEVRSPPGEGTAVVGRVPVAPVSDR